MARERGRRVIATNRKARHDYHLLDVLEAGLVLTLKEPQAAVTPGQSAVLFDGDRLLGGGRIVSAGVAAVA